MYHHTNKKIKTDSELAVISEPEQIVRKSKIPKQPTITLNDDCILAILEHSDILDLANIARSSKYLKDLAMNIFKRKHKCVQFKCRDVTMNIKAIHLFQHFGSQIVKLDLKFPEEDFSVPMLDAIVEHCVSIKSFRLDHFYVPNTKFWFRRMALLFGRLEKLHLKNFFIGESPIYATTTLYENAIDLFKNCTSLVVLILSQSEKFYTPIFQSSFPRLEHFMLEDTFNFSSRSVDDIFMIRHPNLKTLILNSPSFYVHVAPANMANLESVGIYIMTSDRLHEQTSKLLQNF